MTDRRDPQIRALIVELAESSPPAPSYRELEEQVGPLPVEARRPPEPHFKVPGWVYGVAAALAVLLAVGGVALFLRDVDEVPPADQTTVPTIPKSVPDGAGMGDPSTWSWTVLGEESLGLMSDGRQLYSVEGWPEVLAVSSSPDGVTWQSIVDTQLLPPIERMAFADGHGLVVFNSLVESGPWNGVAPDPPTVVLFDPDGRVETSEFRPQLPDQLNNYASVEVSAAAVGPNGAVIWTTAILDQHAIAREAFGDEYTESEITAVRDACDGCDLHPEITDGAISLERILSDGTAEQVAGPVPLADFGINEAFLREGSLLWQSTDGQSWRSVPAPAFLGEGELDGSGIAEVEMVGIDDGFVLVYEDEPVDDIGRITDLAIVMYSPDGIDWEEIHLVELPGSEPVQLVPWLGQALLWGNDFWRVTSAGTERLPVSDGPDPIDVSAPFLGAGEAGIVYLHDNGIVYSPDGHFWGSAPIPEEVSELIDTDSLWWGAPPAVGRDTILLWGTPGPDSPYSLLQATAGNR